MSVTKTVFGDDEGLMHGSPENFADVHGVCYKWTSVDTSGHIQTHQTFVSFISYISWWTGVEQLLLCTLWIIIYR